MSEHLAAAWCTSKACIIFPAPVSGEIARPWVRSIRGDSSVQATVSSTVYDIMGAAFTALAVVRPATNRAVMNQC